MLVDLLYLALSLIFLLISCNFMVDSSVKLAQIANISNLVIGAVILALGTSAPEVFISAFAGAKEAGNIALGNAVGSNIANISLALGVSALFICYHISRRNVFIYAGSLALTAILAFIFLYDDVLTSIESFVLLISAGGFIYINIFYIQDSCPDDLTPHNHSLARILITLILSLITMLICSDLFIAHTQKLALSFGISDLIIGLTLVAIGTSLPEIVTAFISVYKKKPGMALGTVIGSNIFNLTIALPAAAISHDLKVSPLAVERDFTAMTILTLILLISLFYTTTRGKSTIGRKTGALLVVLFLLYYGRVLTAL